MENFKDLILEILKEIESHENNLKIAGGRGYATGKAYADKTVGVLKLLGEEELEEQEEYKLKPVKISRKFKKEKNDK